MTGKKILILTSAHGDEVIGTEIMSKLMKGRKSKTCCWLIANPKAYQARTRFIDTDLNRVAPGDKNATTYEDRQAWQIMKQARQYAMILDIHGSNSKTGIFTIVTNPKLENLILAALLPIKNVVIWASTKSKNQGPITQFVRCGVEIECGPQKNRKIETELKAILKKITTNGLNFDITNIQEKKYYRVYGKILKKRNNRNHFQDF